MTRGFSLIEVLIALVLLAVALLGLAATTALVTRMVGRGERSATAAIHATGVLEWLHATGCTTRADGTSTFCRGGVILGRHEWTWSPGGSDVHRVTLRTTYVTTPGRQRTDTMETRISCAPTH